MYHDFFGLNDAPFKITPNLNLFYSGGQRGAILEALLYAVTSGEGIIKVTGEVGSGKTMLCRMLEERLPDNVETIFLTNPTIARDQIQYTLGDELGLNLHKLRPAKVLRSLQENLISKYRQGKHVVLFIDEAQSMPVETFEEIRLLSNLETGDRKLLQVVLFGQPELDVNLQNKKIRQLRERITHSFYLGSFDVKQVREYLSFRLRAVGYRGPELFSPITVRLITWASKGLLRRINILADKSMLAAYAENTHTIKLAHIRAAIRDSELYSFFPKWRVAAVLALLLSCVAINIFWPVHAPLVSGGSDKAVSGHQPVILPPQAIASGVPKPAVTTFAPVSVRSPVIPDKAQVAMPDETPHSQSVNSSVILQNNVNSAAAPVKNSAASTAKILESALSQDEIVQAGKTGEMPPVPQDLSSRLTQPAPEGGESEKDNK